MGKNLAVEIDETTYRHLEALAEERNCKVKDEVAEAIRTHIAQRMSYLNDPFFRIGKAGRSGLGDLSKSHDKYLYGTG